ncbi:hypothetical protein [Amycolatopsis rifamycinica]|uniref:Uncharacterized protein n=1 Tax=Amycolatopsis rifamycinica TaxID=287986 RepID=A0A066TRU2_9PSEU|nr:hypothetical protein [Amycolatopsis rifamycinica]KDN17585.1 hypothetical protein DV20_35240 [Amycolatopsis rifamycinica]
MNTEAERTMALRWLASRGQPVAAPTPFLGALLATRNVAIGGALPWALLFGVLALFGAIGYDSLFGPGATVSTPAYFACFAIQLTLWRSARSRQRALAKVTHPWPGPVPRTPGGWFIASVALAYCGGAALSLALFSTPARTYAVSWLGLLALSALCTGCVLAGFLRAPVLAVDGPSLAVYRALLAENIHVAAPALAAVPPILDVARADRLPAGYGAALAGYAALVVGTELVAYLRSRRPLPPGHYGEPGAGVIGG